MKKILLASLALAASAFSLSPAEPVNQVSILTGCGPDAGKTGAAIATPTFNGSGNNQFFVSGSNPAYSQIVSQASLSVTTGKNVVVDAFTRGFTIFNYEFINSSSALDCHSGWFYGVSSFTLKRN